MPSGVRRRKHNRSSISKNTRRIKTKHKKLTINNDIIAQHWDKSLTLVQNYKKLGLRSKLGSAAGGSEKIITNNLSDREGEQEIKSMSMATKVVKEGRIIRDENGNVRIEYDEEESASTGENVEQSEAVKALEEHARTGITKPRVQSEREQDWVQVLVDKYGDDYEAMFWDKKLNIYQQSIGELKRRVYKWRKATKTRT
jgi:nucleolar protein 16